MSGFNTNQFNRICFIHQQIALNKYPNCKTLAENLKVSEMTIHRDMNVMRGLKPEGFEAPIEFSALENGFFYSQEFELPILKTINENELQILSTAKILLSFFYPLQ